MRTLEYIRQKNLEFLKQYEWVGSPPEPWLEHFEPLPIRTLYCPECDSWRLPPDSKILWTTHLFKCTRGVSEDGIPRQILVTCPECNNELILRPDQYEGDLNWKWYHHTLVPYSSDLGVSSHFFELLDAKINQGHSLQVTFTGRAGTGKTYTMLKLAQILSPYVNIENIIFERSEFVSLVRKAKPKTILCVDETSYMAGKRSWANAEQKQLMLVWESLRFKLLPIFTTVINISLYDKTLREFLIVYQVNMNERGVATAYSLHPHPLEDYVGKHFIQKLYLPMPDFNYCKKKSCLLPRCKHVDMCPLLRGQYEKKKSEIQNRRYREAEESMVKTAGKKLPDYLGEYLEIADKCAVTIGKTMRPSKELIQLELACSSYIAQKLALLAKHRSKEELRAYLEKVRKVK